MKHLLILFILISIFSCETNPTKSSPSSITKDLTAQEFKTLIETNKGTLIDVRTLEEFNEGSIYGAKNIDFLNSEFTANIKALELEPTKPIYVYCHAGGRSSKAMKVLKQNGYTEVYNLIDGYGHWPFK